MLTLRAMGALCALLLCSQVATANSDPATRAENDLKKYINYVVLQVKGTENPEEKRAILNEALDNLDEALVRVQSLRGIVDIDEDFILAFKDDIREKQSELNGLYGFSQVPDSELDNFADYIQQDLEQSRTLVTISVTTLLLAAILLILLVR